MLAGAGLDVSEEEPTPADNPLSELENLVITPHMAGTSHETDLRADDFVYSNIKRVLAAETALSLVTPDDQYLPTSSLMPRRPSVSEEFLIYSVDFVDGLVDRIG